MLVIRSFHAKDGPFSLRHLSADLNILFSSRWNHAGQALLKGGSNMLSGGQVLFWASKTFSVIEIALRISSKFSVGEDALVYKSAKKPQGVCLARDLRP